MKVLALNGFKQSGKDTIAQYLVENHGYQRLAFGDGLKDLTCKLYTVDREALDSSKLKEEPLLGYPVLPKDDFSLNVAKFMYKEFRTMYGRTPDDYFIDSSGAFMGMYNCHPIQLFWTPRALAILTGSVARTVDTTYWTSKVINTINNSFDNKFVISDLRYRSELNQLQQAFSKKLTTVRISRYATVGSNDPSERDLIDTKFDIELSNYGSLEQLYKDIEEKLV